MSNTTLEPDKTSDKLQGHILLLEEIIHETVSDITGKPCVASKKFLGQILLENNYITSAQLEDALGYQSKNNGRLGWILVTLGYLNKLQLFQALAEHYGLRFRADAEDLINEVDRSLLSKLSHSEVTKFQTIPFSLNGTRLSILTAYPEHAETLKFLKDRYGVSDIEQVVITDLDVTRILVGLFKETILDESVHGLFYRNPEESAFSVFTRSQVVILGLCMAVLLTWAYFDVIGLIIVFNIVVQLFYTASIAFKLFLSLAGVKSEIEKPITDEEIAMLMDKDMPVYTVLVPVYKEPEVIGILIDSLKKLDYPQNKLDIILLLEEDDKATMEAARLNKPPGNWRFVTVPAGNPKTKPKACNYGLFFSRGEYLVIFDAEDIPEPDQLKKSLAAFKKGGKDYVCFQAALNYFNKDENFLTRMFTLEYSYWFDYILPGLNRLKLPIPLGGTSNHFDAEKLKKLGGWDPFNTTEDADLGIRACAEGFKVGVINSTTFEEANSKLDNWIRQRSRWVKGYMQTWLVFSRHPIKLIRVLGLKSWLSFNLFIGGSPFTFLVNPLTWSTFAIWILTGTKAIEPFFPPIILYISLFNLLFGNFLGIYLNMLAVFKRKYYSLQPFAYLNPLYWFLHSIASYKALWQLFTNPFYWEKTQHGITRHKPGA